MASRKSDASRPHPDHGGTTATLPWKKRRWPFCWGSKLCMASCNRFRTWSLHSWWMQLVQLMLVVKVKKMLTMLTRKKIWMLRSCDVSPMWPWFEAVWSCSSCVHRLRNRSSRAKLFRASASASYSFGDEVAFGNNFNLTLVWWKHPEI